GFVVEIDERDTGVDLTGDGDLEDQVPHIWTIDAGVRNLEVAGFVVTGPTNRLWVEVYEAGEGRDLNNDGDIGYERVVHSWDPDRGWHNTGWAAGSVAPLTDGTVIVGVFEEEQGGSDFNGDGSTDGHFAVWLGPDEHRVIGPAYAVHALDDGGALISFEETSAGGLSRDWGLTIWHPDRDAVVLDIPTVNHRSIPGGGAYFRVAESPDYWNYQTACGTGQDLSGDGDCEDFVLHLWTPEEGLVNLGLADWWCPECDWGYVVVGTTAVVSVPQGPGSGEEADGDKEHSVLHIVNDGDVTALEVIPTTATTTWAVLDDGVILTAGPDHTFTFVGVDGTATDLGLSGYAAYALSEGAVLLGDEGMSGLDLNGDGEIAERTSVAHTWHLDSGVVNLGLTVARFESELEGMRPVPPMELPGTGHLVVLVPEREHGAGDLNGDGDLDDAVVHLVRTTAPTDVSIRGDGLGVASFGDGFETAVVALEEHLGPATAILDTPQELASGTAASWFSGGPDATEVAYVWRPFGLTVAFSTYPFFRNDSVLHFSGWGVIDPQTSPGLTTAEGLGIGATVSDVDSLYGARLVLEDGECGRAAWLEPLEAGVSNRVILYFDYSVKDLTDAPLLALSAGAGPGC
ncbi:MAG: hypothetical protein OEX97_00810, partial [Acidimicrobiia bacterium]|nr:hypothetical protein [Acidimicrobiia bacterium]